MYQTTVFNTQIISTVMRIFSVTVLKILGWKVENVLPSSIQKCVIIAAPHTSNWDFPYLLMVAFAIKIRVYWMGKNSLFDFPFQGLMMWLGGIPVDRSISHDMVETYSRSIIKTDKEFKLAIAPEGTRKKAVRWRTGFYYIAVNAKVPIVMGYIDYSKKRSGIGKVFYPTGNFDADMNEIKTFYLPFKGKNPSQFTV